MKLFFKKLLIFIVVTLICSMEIDATNIAVLFLNRFNARSINKTSGYKMGDNIRYERVSIIWNVQDTNLLEKYNKY